MIALKRTLLAALLLLSALAGTGNAGSTDPLFVNLLTDDAHRARMAITFSKNQMEKGHPLTFFFNDRGVRVLSKRSGSRFAEHQKMLSELMAKGAAVIACPMCMQHYGVKEADLISGAKIGNPDLVGSGLFKDNTKTLTW